MANSLSREFAKVLRSFLTRRAPILTDRDYLAELNAQAEAHIARLREATKAAHERLNAGELAAKPPVPPAAAAQPASAQPPDEELPTPAARTPIVQFPDLEAQEIAADDGGIEWDEPS